MLIIQLLLNVCQKLNKYAAPALKYCPQKGAILKNWFITTIIPHKTNSANRKIAKVVIRTIGKMVDIYLEGMMLFNKLLNDYLPLCSTSILLLIYGCYKKIVNSQNPMVCLVGHNKKIVVRQASLMSFFLYLIIFVLMVIYSFFLVLFFKFSSYVTVKNMDYLPRYMGVLATNPWYKMFSYSVGINLFFFLILVGIHHYYDNYAILPLIAGVNYCYDFLWFFVTTLFCMQLILNLVMFLFLFNSFNFTLENFKSDFDNSLRFLKDLFNKEKNLNLYKNLYTAYYQPIIIGLMVLVWFLLFYLGLYFVEHYFLLVKPAPNPRFSNLSMPHSYRAILYFLHFVSLFLVVFFAQCFESYGSTYYTNIPKDVQPIIFTLWCLLLGTFLFEGVYILIWVDEYKHPCDLTLLYYLYNWFWWVQSILLGFFFYIEYFQNQSGSYYFYHRLPNFLFFKFTYWLFGKIFSMFYNNRDFLFFFLLWLIITLLLSMGFCIFDYYVEICNYYFFNVVASTEINGFLFDFLMLMLYLVVLLYISIFLELFQHYKQGWYTLQDLIFNGLGLFVLWVLFFK
jgi:hypothetical protein